MLTLIKAPEIEPVTLLELKAHLRLEHDVEDVYLTNLIRTATEYIENEIQQSFIQRTYEYESTRLFFKDGLRVINLPKGPINELISITFRKLDDSFGNIRRYILKEDAIFVSATLTQPVVVRYSAGFGIYDKHVPAPIKQAILMVAGDCYENRHGFSMEQSSFFRELIKPYRKLSL